jgi:hypothetical protein
VLIPRKGGHESLTRHGRLVVAAAVIALLAAVPLAGADGGTGKQQFRLPQLVHSGTATAAVSAARATPVVLGGTTRQGWPVVIQIAPNGKKVVTAITGIEAGNEQGEVTLSDTFTNLAVKAGRFGTAWGPESIAMDSGFSADCSGSIAGKFSRSGNKVAGTWSYKAVIEDPAGTVLTILDSGPVSWTAKQ